MVKYSKYSKLKDIIVNPNSGLSPIYYISIGPGNFKIESKIVSKKYGEKAVVGWRIFINLDSPGSLLSDSTFKIPIQKVAGNVADFYTLYLNQRYFKKIENPQNPQQPSISHPILEIITEYVNQNYNNKNFKITIDEIRDARKDLSNSSENLNFSILYIMPEIVKTLNTPLSEGTGYLNPEEEDILSLDDISNLTLNIPTLSGSKKLEVETLLNKMFLNDDFKNNSGISTRDLLEIYSSIRDYLSGNQPSKNGIVLYGPPGTGKTYLIESSLMKIYKILGFQTHSQEIGDMLSNQYVGGLATNVSQKIFGPAISLVKKHRTPCFVYIDEATDLLRKAGNSGDGNWRAQGIEAMKSFINKSRYPGIIVCLATNLEKNEFDDALTRDGRLQKIYLGLPNFDRCKQVWNFAIEKILFKDKTILFTSSQIDDLANISKDKINVAAITSISETYVNSINLTWDGNFLDFKKYFGQEAIVRLTDEFDRAKNNLNGISSGNFIGSNELEKEVEKLENTYRKQLHEIEFALDPSKSSTKDEVRSIFGSIFSNKKKIPNRYIKLIGILLSFERIITSNTDNNPFSKKSLILIKRSLKFISWLNDNLLEDKYKLIKDDLNFISRIFQEILKINNNGFTYSELSRGNIIKLVNVINNLPPDLSKII